VSTVGALALVIYDASTRPMVVDSMRRRPYKQPIQASERGQYWCSRRGARLNDVCGGWEQQLGPHQWPGRCVTLPAAHTRGLSSVNPNLRARLEYICAQARQQWTGLVSTARFPDLGLRHTFGLHPWNGDGRGE
jgi:hypothetical protein